MAWIEAAKYQQRPRVWLHKIHSFLQLLLPRLLWKILIGLMVFLDFLAQSPYTAPKQASPKGSICSAHLGTMPSGFVWGFSFKETSWKNWVFQSQLWMTGRRRSDLWRQICQRYVKGMLLAFCFLSSCVVHSCFCTCVALESSFAACISSHVISWYRGSAEQLSNSTIESSN